MPRITSSPRWQWLMSAARFDCVPEGKRSAASKPKISEARACRRLTLGSSPNTSSPSSASIIALRIAAEGRVTVSERRSTVMAEALRELPRDVAERFPQLAQLLVGHAALRPERAQRAEHLPAVAESRHGDAADPLYVLLVVDRMAAGANAPQLGPEGAAGHDGLGGVALEADAREESGKLRRRQPRQDRFRDRCAMQRPARAHILHYAHRAVVLALGDHGDRAVAIDREARALAAAARELGERGLRDSGELLGRPGTPGD